jgi:hypothetical protein
LAGCVAGQLGDVVQGIGDLGQAAVAVAEAGDVIQRVGNAGQLVVVGRVAVLVSNGVQDHKCG